MRRERILVAAVPALRWLFEYSRDNFERQRRVNTVLFACVQELAAENARLRRELEEKGLYVLSLQPRGVSRLAIGGGGRGRVSRTEFLVFNQELATLLKAGMPLVPSLDILRQRVANFDPELPVVVTGDFNAEAAANPSQVYATLPLSAWPGNTKEGDRIAPYFADWIALDPDNLPEADKSKMNFGSGGSSKAKAWRDIWSAGQGIGAIQQILSTAQLVDQLHSEFIQAAEKLHTYSGLT